MNNLRLFLICSFLFFSTNSKGQSVDLATETGFMSKNLSSKIEADGSPYIQDSFERIKISSFPNQTYSGRYNAHSGEMEVKISEEKVIALDVKGNYEITFLESNKVYKGYSYENSNGNKRNRFLVIVQKTADFTLLKEEVINYYEKVKAASSYQKDKPPKFKRESDEYYLELNENLKALGTSKKELQKNFPEVSQDLKSFIKKEKISLKKEEDLKKLSAFLASKIN